MRPVGICGGLETMSVYLFPQHSGFTEEEAEDQLANMKRKSIQ